ncbi:hypothetical protein PRIPAC_75508 [Pristionchus pacificus]|uniref:Uncharacterized protein n=1 Tax=Pristionchus pacificus TaxID=54126 RepID=A0A2A6C7E8_PRIPA|nr:hypothetical protein PRIPAC_75508 [Pristionchus pacificus]|eukprot:PDM73983.1 hypothetical protein PRIPAC_41339 [Pristionchus pacificus]
MASRGILLLILLLATAFIEASPHRQRSHDRSHGSIDLDFYKEHPELVFRACGKPLLRFAVKIQTEICEESNSMRDARARRIPECCMKGCTYDSIIDIVCNRENTLTM